MISFSLPLNIRFTWDNSGFFSETQTRTSLYWMDKISNASIDEVQHLLSRYDADLSENWFQAKYRQARYGDSTVGLIEAFADALLSERPVRNQGIPLGDPKEEKLNSLFARAKFAVDLIVADPSTFTKQKLNRFEIIARVMSAKIQKIILSVETGVEKNRLCAMGEDAVYRLHQHINISNAISLKSQMHTLMAQFDSEEKHEQPNLHNVEFLNNARSQQALANGISLAVDENGTYVAPSRFGPSLFSYPAVLFRNQPGAELESEAELARGPFRIGTQF